MFNRCLALILTVSILFTTFAAGATINNCSRPFQVSLGSNPHTSDRVAWVEGTDECANVIIGNKSYCDNAFALRDVTGLKVQGCDMTDVSHITKDEKDFATCKPYKGPQYAPSNCTIIWEYTCS